MAKAKVILINAEWKNKSAEKEQTWPELRGVFREFWPAELWDWAHAVIKWTWDLLFNTFATIGEYWSAWAVGIRNLVWSKNMKEERERLIKHHCSQARESLKRAGIGAVNALTWVVDTAAWAITTVLCGVRDSWKDTYSWLKNGNNEWNNDEWDKEYAMDGKKWSKEDEEMLMNMNNSGKAIEEISNVLQRKPGAINKKLKQLEKISEKKKQKA